eukprot:TRINITY_DN3952_c0_g1_i1.p1 TRINITY_DN3952_c0_g1~~TRINITY_DN3952_c0_g1_i1.p1  ORF type:complete len:245 (+),score=53.53 TRINITY_DN3952_c0_g1_i1:1165-1899(+)
MSCSRNSISNPELNRSVKKYSSELQEHLGKTTEVLEKLAESCFHIAQIYGATEIPELFEVINQLGETFTKSAASYEALTELVEEKFNWVSKDYTNDLVDLKKLIERYKESKVNCVVAAKMTSEGESLLSQMNVAEWEARSECQNNISKLFPYKEVTMSSEGYEKVARAKEFVGYFCNELPKEYKRMCEGRIREFKKSFTEMSMGCCNKLEKVRINVMVDTWRVGEYARISEFARICAKEYVIMV